MMPDRTRPLIVVDPGHGGIDSGAAGILYESEVNLDLALLFALRAGTSFDALLTRAADKYVTLAERVALANANDASAFLSFHANAAENPDARGFEVWTTPGTTGADALATAIYGSLEAAIGSQMPGRADCDDGDPDKEARFCVLRNTRCPAVLIEFGFITNPADVALLDDVIFQFKAVEAVAWAVTEWLRGER